MKPLLVLILSLLLAAPAFAAGGIKGRTAWRGEVVAGVKVRAYRSIADIPADRALAVSAPTAADGTFTLDLPPGSYYLTARSYATRPRPGDYFCYYSGAPARVNEGRYSNVGFNLIKVPEEAAPTTAARSGITGQVSFQGQPLDHSYLYVYKDAADGFKGPGYFIQPVEKGDFRLRLPPGDYWLLARKRVKGGRFGPVEPGDYFNYYYGNPVHIEAGKVREVKIETVTRLSLFEEDAADFRGIQGQVLNASGDPAAGLYVFGYRSPEMTGTPEAFSARTAGDGSFRLPLPEAGNWYLLARESFGGPAAEGELYGRFGGAAGAPLLFDPAAPLHEVVIHVEPKKNP